MTVTETPPVDLDEITIPDSPDALAEFMADGKKMAAVMKAGLLPEVTRRYAQNYMQAQTDIQAQVRDQVEKTMADFFRQQREEGFVPEPVAAASLRAAAIDPQSKIDQRRGLNNPRAIGAQLDKHFSGPSALADFFTLIWNDRRGTLDPGQAVTLRDIRNAFTSTEGAGGGFLIPEVLRSEILRLNQETAVVRPRARVVPMESLRLSFPAIDETSRASSIHGGIISYWEEEAATHTESAPEFQAITLQARKLVTYTTVPNELLTDSPGALQMFISELFPEALAFDEDDAFIGGDGVGKPLGALNASNNAIISVDAESGQAASTIYWENIIKMYSRMLPQSINRAVWVVSTDVFPELATMALNVGTGGVPVWLPDGQGAPTMNLLGRPIVVTEKTPAALGTVGDISFVDFGFYLVGDRQMMSASSSEHVNFTTDKTAFKIVSRVDGRPWLQSAITPRNGAATLSPFVQLATRS